MVENKEGWEGLRIINKGLFCNRTNARTSQKGAAQCDHTCKQLVDRKKCYYELEGYTQKYFGHRGRQLLDLLQAPV